MLRLYKKYRTEKDSETAHVYDGVGDTDYKTWRNDEYLSRKFDEYNRRFFGNNLPKIPVRIEGKSSKVLGAYHTKLQDTTQLKADLAKELEDKDIYKPYQQYWIKNELEKRMKFESDYIHLSNVNWKDRKTFEDTLIHEMCHVYQYEILCNMLCSEVRKDCKLGSGSKGHGPKFFEAADLVNNSPDNVEGFHITQYAAPDDATRVAYKKADGYFYLYVDDCCVMCCEFRSERNRKHPNEFHPFEYEFTYRDGDAKAQLKPTKVQRLSVWGPSADKYAEAILSGELVLIKYRSEKVLMEDMDFKANLETNQDSVCIFNGVKGVRCSGKDGKDLLNSRPTKGALTLLGKLVNSCLSNKVDAERSEREMQDWRVDVHESLLIHILQVSENIVGLYQDHLSPSYGKKLSEIVDGFTENGMEGLEDVLYSLDENDLLNWLEYEIADRLVG